MSSAVTIAFKMPVYLHTTIVFSDEQYQKILEPYDLENAPTLDEFYAMLSQTPPYIIRYSRKYKRYLNLFVILAQQFTTVLFKNKTDMQYYKLTYEEKVEDSYSPTRLTRLEDIDIASQPMIYYTSND